MSKDFQISLKYQNNLPSAPSGPFFKHVGLFHSFEKFGEYRLSSLEKNHVWQPHFGPDIGLNLDLVDQEAMLIQDQGGIPPVPDQADLKYLHGIVDKGRGKQKQIDQSSKPWWLRNTTYMENNLFNTVINKNHDVESTIKLNEQKRKQMGDVHDPFSEEFIESSFRLLDKTIADLRRKAKGGVSWEIPLLPLDLPENLQQPDGGNDKSYSLVRFDEDPLVSLSVDIAKKEGGGSEEVDPATKRRRITQAIATNFRQSQNEDLQFGKASSTIEVSLVAPTAADSAGAVAVPRLFEWVRDYRMEVADTRVEDGFLVVIGPVQAADGSGAASANASVPAAGSAGYFAIRSRVDMKKMSAEDSRPHDCTVLVQRDPEDAEPEE